MKIVLDLNSADDYRLFLKIKALPCYGFAGREASFPNEYAESLGRTMPTSPAQTYRPISGLFDYQRDVSKLAIARRKFALFIQMGYGKTLIILEYARHVESVLPPGKCVLIVSPLMVVNQTVEESLRFYGDSLPIRKVTASELPAWLESGTERIGITNYEAITTKVKRGRLGALILDEGSLMKSHYGKWGVRLIELGKGLEWKLCSTGTPAPNDRIEYANHAVFLDAFPTVNSFLSRFFVNRGQTNERWEMKAHAIRPFYRALSHWCIFMTNPATYGWKDNCGTIPPIHVHVHDVPLTDAQQSAAMKQTGMLYVTAPGGITGRSKLARIAKGGDSLKPAFIRDLIRGWPAESTLVWCRFNDEQDTLAKVIPGAASIEGKTPIPERIRLIDEFKAGRIKTLISKPEVMGFGLNLQVATRQVFSSLHDSYEDYAQAVARSNRVGSTRPLNVHIPVTDAEWPMVETVLRKADRVQQDANEQEIIFKESRYA